jgi:ParB family chromosome partitioning protein
LNVREAEQLGDLAKEAGGDIERALATIRSKRAGRTGGGPRPPATPQKATTVSRETVFSADDQEIKWQMERILGTPVSIVRTEKDLRVTIVFHTEEKLQEFFDVLNGV